MQKIAFMDKKISFKKDFAYCGRLNSETKCGNLGKVLWFSSNSTAIPRDMLPLNMLTPQIRHYALRQKNSRYANFSDLSTSSSAIF